MFWNWFGFRGPRSRRFIFTYRDGTRSRRADPVAVDRVLKRELGTDWYDVVRRLGKPPAGLVGEQADAALVEWETSRVKVVNTVCTAFGVHPLTDKDGLTEAELYGLLDGYIRFCSDLVELARPFPNARSRASPTPTPPPPAKAPESTCPAT